jgi:hypothetical protein
MCLLFLSLILYHMQIDHYDSPLNWLITGCWQILFNLLRQARPVTRKSTPNRHTIFMIIKVHVVKTITSNSTDRILGNEKDDE